MSARTSYTIQYLPQVPNAKNEWTPFVPYRKMVWSYAEGAWSMLKTFNGGIRQYRLVDSSGIVINVCGPVKTEH
jgi:hypothetical protein